jgi:hypothetical protein
MTVTSIVFESNTMQIKDLTKNATGRKVLLGVIGVSSNAAFSWTQPETKRKKKLSHTQSTLKAMARMSSSLWLVLALALCSGFIAGTRAVRLADHTAHLATVQVLEEDARGSHLHLRVSTRTRSAIMLRCCLCSVCLFVCAHSN